MVIIQHNGIKYECTLAIRGSDYVHLLDKGCCMLAQFNGVTDFSAFTFEMGRWTVANDAYEYYVKTLGRTCQDKSGTQVSWDTALFNYLQNFIGAGGTSGAVDILDKVYPVGSIYMSTRDTNPGALLGGTWQKYDGSASGLTCYMWERVDRMVLGIGVLGKARLGM